MKVNKETNKNKAPTQPKKVDQQLITLRGYTTSQINQALKADNPYPARVFLKVDNQEQDIPVFFRIKDEIKGQFREFLDPNYIGTYEMEIKECPFCKETLETKYYRKWCWNEECLEEFRLFEKSGGWIRPKIKTGSYLQVGGKWTTNQQRPKGCIMRKSFTATSYTLLACPHFQKKPYFCPIDCPCLKGKEILNQQTILSHGK